MLEKEALEIIEKIACGSSLTDALGSDARTRHAFQKVIFNSPTLQTLYAQAQQFRAELHADEIIDIADTGIDPMRDKLRIDARKWHASKMNPKFSDQVHLNVSGQVDLTAALLEARSRALGHDDDPFS